MIICQSRSHDEAWWSCECLDLIQYVSPGTIWKIGVTDHDRHVPPAQSCYGFLAGTRLYDPPVRLIENMAQGVVVFGCSTNRKNAELECRDIIYRFARGGGMPWSM